jgi:hypothetical protein
VAVIRMPGIRVADKQLALRDENGSGFASGHFSLDSSPLFTLVSKKS